MQTVVKKNKYRCVYYGYLTTLSNFIIPHNKNSKLTVTMLHYSSLFVPNPLNCITNRYTAIRYIIVRMIKILDLIFKISVMSYKIST